MWGRNQINIPEKVQKCVCTQRFFSSLHQRDRYTSLPENSLGRYDVTLIRITPATVMLAQRCSVQPAYNFKLGSLHTILILP